MSVLAGRALDEDSAPMIAKLGYPVGGAVLAWLASECQLVGRLVGSRSVVWYGWVRRCGRRCSKTGVVTNEELGAWHRPQESRCRSRM